MNNNSQGLAYVVVGKTKSGKTTFVRQEFAERVADPDKVYVYDVGNEYGSGEFEGEFSDWVEGLRGRKNSLIIIEEATMNLGSRSEMTSERNKPLARAMTRKRHDNNLIIFVFHSLHRVPDSIVHFVDGWYIFRTLDNPKKVREKYSDMPHVLQAYEKVQDKPKFSYIYTEIPD